ncbi:MAG TPA: UDP-N-acetylglucosamine--N-acetylmuramyl-(pentapeptide) pyrophosphoryl-undecaprenol N-acetylglucosamine transferase [Candidatus Paceibacterota bacterium]
MKIIFTGGGTGGHFYPIIAIAQAVHKISKENKLLEPDMYFFAPSPYNPGLLYDNDINYRKTTSGKIRRYFSFLNIIDFFKMGWGAVSTLFDVFDVYPDVVFGKGGYGSFPTLLAARILRIPVVIHESDSVPGRVNKWAGKFAARVALSWLEAAKYFPEAVKRGRVVHTGQPIRDVILEPATNGAHRFFELEESVPTIVIRGGSSGAEMINNVIMDALPQLVENYQVIHQTGQNNFKVVKETADAILLNNRHRERYKPFAYFNQLEEQMSAGAATLVISRAGSTIFEIAAWGKPSIIIPITDSNGDHQLNNALSYAGSGAASVIEEANLTSHVFFGEIKRIIDDQVLRSKMAEKAKAFFKPEADRAVAKELLAIALSHEELG